MENANELLFRCSGLGNLITKNGAITDGLKTYLTKVYVENRYERRKEVKSKYLDKGNEREEDAITLLSRIKKELYVNNKERKSNAFITGEWDIAKENEKGKIIKTLDTKVSWDIETFHQSKIKESKDYKWQGVGYMWLTGAIEHEVAYCLINGTASHIKAEKNRKKWEFIDDTIDVELYEPYLEACREIEKNHIFDMEAFREENPHFDLDFNLDYWKYDIPFADRVHTKLYQRDEAEIANATGAIINARNWINKVHFNL